MVIQVTEYGYAGAKRSEIKSREPRLFYGIMDYHIPTRGKAHNAPRAEKR